MKPYPRNDVEYNIILPRYAKNIQNLNSRYSIYRKITNLPFTVLEVKLTNVISKNPTYKGYYHTAKQNETLYQIAKNYYGNENYYWVIAKANNLKDDSMLIVPKGTTIIVPAFSELTNNGGYFNMT